MLFPEVARKCEIKGMTILYWNTQRMYTPGGQRMVAVEIECCSEKGILFLDLDRHIDGVIDSCDLKEDQIMKCYDRNGYHAPGNQDEYCALRDLFAIKEEFVKLF